MDAIEIRRRVVRLVAYFLSIFLVLVLGYEFEPTLAYTFQIPFPGLGFSLGLVIYVIVFTVLCLMLLGFIKNALRLTGLKASAFATLLSSLSVGHGNPGKRILTNLVFIALILAISWLVRPVFQYIPTIGTNLASAFQLIVAAICILVFWDIGRTIYKQLEHVADRLAEETLEKPLRLKVKKTEN